jgi:hypothetical protein
VKDRYRNGFEHSHNAFEGRVKPKFKHLKKNTPARIAAKKCCCWALIDGSMISARPTKIEACLKNKKKDEYGLN